MVLNSLNLKAQKKVVAIIAAAGEGKRLKSPRSKIFARIKDKPLILFSLKAFSCHPLINEIILICNRKTIRQVKRLVEKGHFSKVKHIILGGPTRRDSVANGIKIIKPQREKLILIHDAARPLINKSLISRLIKNAFEFDAVICAVPVKATIKSVKLGLFVDKTLKRDNLWEVQTPQVFRSDLLKRAYSRFGRLAVTDDATLLEKMGKGVKIVLGSYSNIKITTKEDLIFAQVLAKKFNPDK